MKTTAQWKVDEVYKSPTGTLVQLSAANYATTGEWWPKVGQVLEVVVNDDK